MCLESPGLIRVPFALRQTPRPVWPGLQSHTRSPLVAAGGAGGGSTGAPLIRIPRRASSLLMFDDTRVLDATEEHKPPSWLMGAVQVRHTHTHTHTHTERERESTHMQVRHIHHTRAGQTRTPHTLNSRGFTSYSDWGVVVVVVAGWRGESAPVGQSVGGEQGMMSVGPDRRVVTTCV